MGIQQPPQQQVWLQALPPEPPDLHLSDHPTLCGAEEAAKWLRENVSPGFSAPSIKRGTESQKPNALPRFMIGNKRWYSTRDLWRWAMARRGVVVKGVSA